MRKLPPHLQPYVAEQHYERYTPVDHAVWRYVMRQNRHALRHAAHDAYLNGLALSGIGTERIPRVSEMNDCLAKIGWGAVIVKGLIPGAVFYELLANGILPIAAEIRKSANIEYTPAPDIIHEAAGHAPLLFDADYRSYVRLIGAIGAKAFSAKEKQEAFEALRRLTIVMEDPASSPEEREAAQRAVEEKQKASAGTTEAELLSRLFWTTVEYGLIGPMDDPKLYGAGLLSSVGESKHCFTDAVAKLPYSVEACTEHPKIVTEMQKRLFVCDSFGQLKAGAEALADTMAYRIGGTESLTRAQRSGMVATFAYNSGLGVTGCVQTLVQDESGEAVYVKTIGATALTVRGRPLHGQGKDAHARGFGSPIGLLKGGIALEACGDQALAELGVSLGSRAALAFESGILVKGLVTAIARSEGQVVLITFAACSVTYEGQELFKPEWGDYDMAVGSRIVTAYPGAADPASYYDDYAAHTVRGGTILEQAQPLTRLEALYRQAAAIREERADALTEEQLQAIAGIHRELGRIDPEDWLLRLELLEIAAPEQALASLAKTLTEELHTLGQNKSVANVIQNGLAIV